MTTKTKKKTGSKTVKKKAAKKIDAPEVEAMAPEMELEEDAGDVVETEASLSPIDVKRMISA